MFSYSIHNISFFVAVEIFCVSELLYEFRIRENPHFTINLIYYEDTDVLKISFVNFTPLVFEFKKTEEGDIEVGMDNAWKIVYFFIMPVIDC